MSIAYRPIGPLRWMLKKLPLCRKWDVIGSVSAEARGVTVFSELSQLNKLRSGIRLRIADEQSPYEVGTRAAWANQERDFNATIPTSVPIRDENLFSGISELTALVDEIEASHKANVILDISAIPKRFFFFILRSLIESPSVMNLLVTYTTPERYGSKLYDTAGGWEPLPGFGMVRADKTNPLLIIAVGYHHLNLQEVIHDSEPRKVLLLMPFPSKPPGSISNWEFVRYVDDQVKLNPNNIIRVHTHSASLAFEHLTGKCKTHSDEIILAPFGPKPISLAMALFAIAREKKRLPLTVGYTQPRAYSHEYSFGVEIGHDGLPVVHTYGVKLNGKNLYELN